MNAVANRPRARAAGSATSKTKHLAPVSESIEERLYKFRAVFREADKQLEGAYDATEPGSAIERLLDHVSHNLLVDAIGPMLKDKPTCADAEKTHEAMTVTLAALQGVVSMTADLPIVPALHHGLELLHWIQQECKAMALEQALSEPDLAADFVRGRDHAVAMMEEAIAVQDEREGWRWLREGKAQDNLVDSYLADVIEDPSLRHGFTSVLSAAIQNDTCLSALKTITLAETQAGEIGADGTSKPKDELPLSAFPTTVARQPDEASVRRELAFECNWEIEKLAGALKKLSEGGDDRPIFHGILSRIEQMSECVYFLMKLHGEEDAEWNYDFTRITSVNEGRIV